MQLAKGLKSAILAGVAATLMAPTGAYAGKLNIIWNKAFFQEEDDALLAFAKQWEAKTGNSVEITFVPVADVIPKVVAAMEAGTPPDIAFGHLFDWQATPRWAFEDKLADVSDIIAPIKSDFLPGIDESIQMVNGATGEKGYYVIPVEQQTDHLHYWTDILGDAGYTEADIPSDWNGFWNFWCSDVQKKARAAGNRVFGVGKIYSSASSDSNFHLMMFLSAYGATLVDKSGAFVGDLPENRDKIVEAFADYTSGADSCVPSGAVSWGDGDNNTDFLNRNSVLALNPTLSIPASQKDKNPDNYYKNIRTIPWPKGPDGSVFPVMTSVKHAVIFKGAAEEELARSFMADLVKPENLKPYVEGSQGRWQPVLASLFNDPFWTDPTDPHRNAAYIQYTTSGTLPFPQIYNYKYTQVQAENLLARAASQIVLDGKSPADAVDEMNARIREILK